MLDHERIWLEPRTEDDQYGPEGRLWCEDKVWPGSPDEGEPTEYVRADIHAAALALIESQRATIERVERERDDEHQRARDNSWDYAVMRDRVTALEAEKVKAIRALELADGRLALLLREFPDESRASDHPVATRYVKNVVQEALATLRRDEGVQS